ncbi:MAG: type I methionyl aminopeptidase [Candidatus Doudnabacteria bacterium CG10_big_fil_rev_8_21_14_0_10_42_18]|uniref:Methionine aminopeptidase n=1 Tax=Candidatus Doudnabacteria bacterium CG10_big_fil_rev_8_21_14_0_10_42_18 TaxID=1974552 RepID=A0A2H0VAW8_9BACT|nr:MAG: type I methionyl aminopeptidase [Candidatus Doudnabacteria bacterium CG10_big_fil_rev_8_21_14_0_10_42_18]
MKKNNYVKTREEIEIIAQGGKLLRNILHNSAKLAVPGTSTAELNQFAEKEIAKIGGRPSFKGYGEKGNEFPAGLCTSINDVIVHGIPSRDAALTEGDIISLDIGMEYKGLYTDTAITVPVGKVSGKILKLVNTTKQCLYEAVKMAKAGNKTGDIGHAIQSLAEDAGFSVVRDLVGHGVGYSVHEDPPVPCYGKSEQGIKLEEGMVLAIEPMLCEGNWKILIDDDGWTIRTADGSLSAHFEHTIAVGKNGGRVLT